MELDPPLALLWKRPTPMFQHAFLCMAKMIYRSIAYLWVIQICMLIVHGL